MTEHNGRLAYSIQEFCQLHGFAVSTYYSWSEEDRPEVMRVKGAVRISVEAAAKWRRRMARRKPNRAGVGEPRGNRDE